jgi:uroporphyrin-III C-methyltransferase/precorrin-2 dehydrogenase/sirohydrochlorin ferrochelatase
MASRAAIAAALVDAGRAADTPVAVIQDGTTPTQRMVRTTLAGLPDVDLCAPAIIVVGPVVDIVPRASRTARG